MSQKPNVTIASSNLACGKNIREGIPWGNFQNKTKGGAEGYLSNWLGSSAIEVW